MQLMSYPALETPWAMAHQFYLSFPFSQSLLKLMSIEAVMPSNHLILCHHLHLLPSIFSSIRAFSNDLAVHISWPKELHLQHQSFQWIVTVDVLLDWLVWSGWPRDSQESSQAPQFEGINSLTLSLFYCPTLTCIHDSWKNLSFD